MNIKNAILLTVLAAFGPFKSYGADVQQPSNAVLGGLYISNDVQMMETLSRNSQTFNYVPIWPPSLRDGGEGNEKGKAKVAELLAAESLVGISEYSDIVRDLKNGLIRMEQEKLLSTTAGEGVGYFPVIHVTFSRSSQYNASLDKYEPVYSLAVRLYIKVRDEDREYYIDQKNHGWLAGEEVIIYDVLWDFISLLLREMDITVLLQSKENIDKKAQELLVSDPLLIGNVQETPQ